MSFVKATVIGTAIVAVSATSAVARDQVHIAGSSTVLPYASIVAEAFGENFDFPTPIVEGGGSGAGRKRMCEGVGPEHNRHCKLIIIDEGGAVGNLVKRLLAQ
jgi:phosphate transport system substrate-binding protein